MPDSLLLKEVPCQSLPQGTKKIPQVYTKGNLFFIFFFEFVQRLGLLRLFWAKNELFYIYGVHHV